LWTTNQVSIRFGSPHIAVSTEERQTESLETDGYSGLKIPSVPSEVVLAVGPSRPAGILAPLFRNHCERRLIIPRGDKKKRLVMLDHLVEVTRISATANPVKDKSEKLRPTMPKNNAHDFFAGETFVPRAWPNDKRPAAPNTKPNIGPKIIATAINVMEKAIRDSRSIT
jgi:hypothetical protein